MATNRSQRDESYAERMDRNWNELLQELRVVQTGVQVLAGFLITLPFQNRFSALIPGQQDLYLAILICALVAVCLLMAPVAVHRALFREQVKGNIVQAGHRLAQWGMGFLALTIIGSGTLIGWVVVGVTAGIIAFAAAVSVITLLWVVLPVALRRAGARPQPQIH